MARKPKVTFNCDEEMLKIIDSIGVSLSFTSRSETILYLLKKAIYIETENVTASYVQVFLKEELDKLTKTLIEEIEFAIDESKLDEIEQVKDLAKRSNVLSLANLIVGSNVYAMTDTEAADIREEALQAAYDIEGDE